MKYLDIIVCGVLCLLHIIFTLVFDLRNGKKIKEVCSKCLAPVYYGEDHVCDLTHDQLQKLVEFVLSIQKKDGENNG